MRMKVVQILAVCLLLYVSLEVASGNHLEAFGCRGTRYISTRVVYRARCGFYSYCLRYYYVRRLQYTLKQSNCPSTCGGCGASGVVQQEACFGMTLRRVTRRYWCGTRYCSYVVDIPQYGYICCTGYTKINFAECRRITMSGEDPDTSLACGTNKYGANTLFQETDGVGGYEDIDSDGYTDASPRIIGGKGALQGQFPWQVRLSIRMGTGTASCGGSIIARRWILTAAHCVVNGVVSQSYVIVGDHKVSQVEPSQVTIRVQQIIIHPGYNTAATQVTNNDIALIELVSPITYNQDLSPVCLPSTAKTYTGRTVLISGWGWVNQAGQKADTLQYTRATVVSDSQCDPSGIRINEICAVGQGPSTSCRGDSGGPMTILESGRAYLIGVTWYGHSACEPSRAFAYTDVGPYLSWIKSNINTP